MFIVVCFGIIYPIYLYLCRVDTENLKDWTLSNNTPPASRSHFALFDVLNYFTHISIFLYLKMNLLFSFSLIHTHAKNSCFRGYIGFIW